jgi:hypothetical protein
MYNSEDIDPRILEIQQAHKSQLLHKLRTSFRDPNDMFAWIILSWTLSLLVLSPFAGLGTDLVLASLISFLMAGFRQRYCID